MSDAKAINVSIGSIDDMGARFTAAWHRAEAGEAVDESHLTFPDLPALLAALTPKRLELLRHVRRNQVSSISALATMLKRDYRNVHQDVDALSKLGLLEKSPSAVRAPFATVDAHFAL